MPPRTILFDVNGTLLDPGAIGQPWAAPDLGLAVLRAAVSTAMVDTITGDFRPFAQHVRAAVVLEVARHGLDPSRVDDATQRASSLPPFPDAAPALDALAAAGHRLAVLTNSGAEQGRAALESAGLADRFEHILGTDAVRAYKPHPATYAHALRELDASAEQVTLVAAHGWDVTGAKRARLCTAWIARGEGELTPAAPPPDVRAADLLDAARQLAST